MNDDYAVDIVREFIARVDELPSKPMAIKLTSTEADLAMRYSKNAGLPDDHPGYFYGMQIIESDGPISDEERFIFID